LPKFRVLTFPTVDLMGPGLGRSRFFFRFPVCDLKAVTSPECFFFFFSSRTTTPNFSSQIFFSSPKRQGWTWRSTWFRQTFFKVCPNREAGLVPPPPGAGGSGMGAILSFCSFPTLLRCLKEGKAQDPVHQLPPPMTLFCWILLHAWYTFQEKRVG